MSQFLVVKLMIFWYELGILFSELIFLCFRELFIIQKLFKIGVFLLGFFFGVMMQRNEFFVGVKTFRGMWLFIIFGLGDFELIVGFC